MLVFTQARLSGKQLGRPLTATLHAVEIRKLHRAGVAKAEIARRLQIGRTSVRRILAGPIAAEICPPRKMQAGQQEPLRCSYPIQD